MKKCTIATFCKIVYDTRSTCAHRPWTLYVILKEKKTHIHVRVYKKKLCDFYIKQSLECKRKLSLKNRFFCNSSLPPSSCPLSFHPFSFSHHCFFPSSILRLFVSVPIIKKIMEYIYKYIFPPIYERGRQKNAYLYV